jgi:hypothetical protein
MSLDLLPIMKTSWVDAGKKHAPQVSRGCERTDVIKEPELNAGLSDLEAQGSYRILDHDAHVLSTNDAKRMWQRCMQNIMAFAFSSDQEKMDNEKSSFQFGGRIHAHMSLRPLQHKDIKISSPQMHTSFKNAMERWTENHTNPHAADVHGIAMKIRRLMLCSFRLLSQEINTDVWFLQQFEEIDSCITSSKGWLGQNSFSFQRNHIDAHSSLMFMLANAFYNCGVALKLSLCTQVGYFLNAVFSL